MLAPPLVSALPLRMSAPLKLALFPATMLSVRVVVAVGSSTQIAPPASVAKFPESVLCVIVSVPEWKIAPP